VAGKQVVKTLGEGILVADAMSLTVTSIVLLSVSLSLLTANLMGIPQSTSQSTVLSLSGMAVYLHSFSSNKLLVDIIPTWFVLPVVAFFVVYWLSVFLRGLIQRSERISMAEISAHPALRWAVIITSGYVAFSIGANNVANAAGPIASMVGKELHIPATHVNFSLIMMVSTLIIAPCFGIGSAVLGGKIVETSGRQVVTISPVEACLISFVTASLLLAASLFKGIPTSLVQLQMAAVLAVGVNKVGWRHILSDHTVQRFWRVWLIAPLFSFLFSMALAWLADLLGVLHY
jgi:phosphate/sulfate permease